MIDLSEDDRFRASQIGQELLRAFYDSRLEDLRTDCESLKNLVEIQLNKAGLTGYTVSAKPKDLPSALDKIKRKCSDGDSDYSRRLLSGEQPQLIITDLVRGRVSCRFSDEIDIVRNILSSQLGISCAHSVDHRKPTEANSFGYAAMHVVFEPADQVLPQFFFSGCYMELQIRSVLMNQWSVVNWGIDYKSLRPLSYDLQRRLASISALFHLVDREFILLRDNEELANIISDELFPILRDDVKWRPRQELLHAMAVRGVEFSESDSARGRQLMDSVMQHEIKEDLSMIDVDALVLFLVDSNRFYWTTTEAERGVARRIGT